MGGKKNSHRRSNKDEALEANARKVGLSKHELSLLQAANELCSLEDTEAAVILFTPDGQAYSVGNADGDAVMKRFLDRYPIPDAAKAQLEKTVQANKEQEENLNKLDQQYKELADQLAAEKKRGKMLKQMKKKNGNPNLWEVPVEKLSTKELETQDAMLRGLQRKLAGRYAGTSSDGAGPSSRE